MSNFKHAVVIAMFCSLYFSTLLSAENLKTNQSKLFSINIENGKEQFRTCTLCHSPEGWGTADGY